MFPGNALHNPVPTVITWAVLHKVKKQGHLANIPSLPSQTSAPGLKPSRGSKISKWYHLGHWFAKGWRDFKHYWNFIWKKQGAGHEWTKKLQYPQPGDVIWYPVRPDLNPYLDPEHPDQPQISPE